MVSKFALLSNLLLASAALAVPSPRPTGRFSRRQGNRQSKPMKHVASPAGSVSATEFSENWAGVVVVEPDDTFDYVSASFTVPSPSGENGSGAAIWIGLDGDTCGSALLQTGILFAIDDGEVTFEPFFEWYPAEAYVWDDFAISPGDVIAASVYATSPTAGVVSLENQTTGQTVTENLTSTSSLCEANAEWIVEDYEDDGSLVPLADFGSVPFIYAYATGSSGVQYNPYDGTPIDIEQNDVVLTSLLIGVETLTVEYVG